MARDRMLRGSRRGAPEVMVGMGGVATAAGLGAGVQGHLVRGCYDPECAQSNDLSAVIPPGS